VRAGTVRESATRCSRSSPWAAHRVAFWLRGDNEACSLLRVVRGVRVSGIRRGLDPLARYEERPG